MTRCRLKKAAPRYRAGGKATHGRLQKEAGSVAPNNDASKEALSHSLMSHVTSGLVWETFGFPGMGQLGLAGGGSALLWRLWWAFCLSAGAYSAISTPPPVGKLPEELQTGLLHKDNRSVGSYQVSQPANIDSLARQLGLVLCPPFLPDSSRGACLHVSEVGGSLPS